MTILFNGKIGARQYRILIFVIDGQLIGYRPYIGYYEFVGDVDYDSECYKEDITL